MELVWRELVNDLKDACSLTNDIQKMYKNKMKYQQKLPKEKHKDSKPTLKLQ
jgi:hypothetical protein